MSKEDEQKVKNTFFFLVFLFVSFLKSIERNRERERGFKFICFSGVMKTNKICNKINKYNEESQNAKFCCTSSHLVCFSWKE